MSNKTLLILSGLVVVLLVLFLLTRENTIPKAEVHMIAEIDSALVTEITIEKEDQTLTLTRKEDGWYITRPIDYMATKSFVKTLLGKLTGMRIESKITDKKERWADFEVDDAKGKKVTVKQGDKTDTFIIGKVASGYRQSYARLLDEDTVYLINGSYASSLNRKVDNWREKKVADIKDTAIIGVVTDKLTLKKEDDGWRITPKKGESFLADEDKVKRHLGSISRLRTAEFPDSSDYASINFDKPLHFMKVELSSGDTREIKFYTDPSQEDRYFFTYHKKPYVFRCYGAILRQLIRDPDEFKAEEKDA